MKPDRARLIAAALCDELAPACHRIEPAGSVRREERKIGDIEICAVPRYRTEVALQVQESLFPTPEAEPLPTVEVNELWEAVERLRIDGRVEPMRPTSKVETLAGGEPAIEPDDRWPEKRLGESRMWKLWLPRAGVKVDLFLATFSTWACIFVIRTGSRYFSRALVERWQRVSRGGHFCRGRMHRRHNPEGGRKPWGYTRKNEPLGPPLDTLEEEDVFRAMGLLCPPPPQRRSGDDLQPDPEARDPLPGHVDHGCDLVVTVPMAAWRDWLAEGDLPGESWSGLESHFYLSRPPRTHPGARVYIVAHGRLRGWAPLVRVEGNALVRCGGAQAVTIDEPIRGFRGARYRWWLRVDERPFPDWQTEGVDL